MSTSLTDILRRRRTRQPLDETLPSGESVYDLVNRQAQVLTPQNQQAITRPRTTSPLPNKSVMDALHNDMQTPSEADRARTVTFNPVTGQPNEDYYRTRGDTAGLYNAYQNWNPHGGKRGFKNSLKGGLVMASQAVQANPDDPVAAAIAGFGAGLGGATASPNFTNRLRRQQRLGQYGVELKNQLGLQREQALIDSATMVPVILDNGQQVLVPAKQAATLASHQQEIGLRGDTLEARKKRWDALGEHEGARDAQALYNSGGADNSTELRAEIAKRLRLPTGTVLPPRGLGNQVKLDEYGNYVVISPRTGAVTPTQTPGGQPAGSFQKTQEGNRDTRQRRALDAAAARVAAQQSGANQRAGMRGTGSTRLDPTTKRDIAKGYGEYDEFQTGLSNLDDQIKQANALPDNWTSSDGKDTKNALLTRLGRRRNDAVNAIKKRMAELNQLDPENEWGSGAGGYPYRKPRATQSGQEDPKVRAYADRYFGGNYSAAQDAIKKQRGQ